MKLITALFIINAVLLILHEIESAYEREWEILKLPGRITGFLLLHIPILFLLFFGLIEVEKSSLFGLIIGIVFGIGGCIPFVVHKLIVNRKDKFNLLISNIIIYLNAIIGAGVLICIISTLF